MSEKVPSITEKNVVIDDAVSLFSEGNIYDGWETASITRELNSIASSFNLGLTDIWTIDNQKWRLKPGDSAEIHIGKTAIVNGYLDALNISFSAQQRVINALGRSKTADLVDCSYVGPNEFSPLPINSIVQKLIEPFGLSVELKSDAGANFNKFNIRTGETVFEAIDRLARARTLLVYPSFDGNVVLEKKGAKRASTELRQGINILSGSANFDNTNRYSDYIVKGQAAGIIGSKEDARKAKGEAKDAGILRYRPIQLIAENNTDTGGTKERAKYEAAIRAAKSSQVQITTQGWFQADGTPWDINQIIGVYAPFLGIRVDMLCVGATYRKSNSGTTTTLRLIREDAFEFKETVEKDKDPFADLGI